MKKAILITSLVLASFVLNAQNITEYKASNGITYHVKDTVKLGRGVGIDGIFLYLLPGGIESLEDGAHSPDRMNIRKTFTNASVIIKKIKSKNIKGTIKYWSVVTGGYIYPFNLSIEEAIQTCEVLPCISESGKQSLSVADEIKKLKALLDSGAITQSEYDSQKKKLLNAD